MYDVPSDYKWPSAVPTKEDVKRLMQTPLMRQGALLAVSVLAQEEKWKPLHDAIEEVYPHVKFWLAKHPNSMLESIPDQRGALSMLLACIAKGGDTRALVETIFGVEHAE